MGKSFEFKECERFLKRVLKDKGMYSKGAVIAFLITGGIGFFAPPAQAIVYVETKLETGATGASWYGNREGNIDLDRNSVVLAPLKNGNTYGDLNRGANNSVIIGTGAYAHGTVDGGREEKFTAVGNNAHVAGGQGTAIGNNTFAVKQATAVGNDVYAAGESSVAIGNDDISSKYKDSLSIATLKAIFGDGESGNPAVAKLFREGKWYSSQNDARGPFKLTSWQDFKRSYLSPGTEMYSPTYSGGIGAIAIGSRSIAFKDGSTAIGTLSYAFGEGSTAMGLRAFTSDNAKGAVAIGEQSRSFAPQSLAVGNRNESTDDGAMSYGYSAKAVGKGSLAFGFKTYANASIADNIAAADGHSATNPLRQAVRSKLGNYSETQLAALETYQNAVRAYYKKIDDRASETAIAAAKTAMDTAKANVDAISLTDVNAMSLVDGGQVSHQSWNTVGNTIKSVVDAVEDKNATNKLTVEKLDGVYLTTKDEDGNTQKVQKSKKSGDNAIAIGYYASAKGTSAIAQGSGSVVDSLSGIGIGSLSYVSENSANSIAVGVGAQVRKENSIAIGTQSQVFGAGAIGMGPGSRVMGDNSVAMGYGTDIRSVSSIGLGVRAKVGYGSMNATGLGANVEIGTDAGNTVALGSSASIGDNSLNSMAVGYNANVAKNTQNSIAFGTRASIAEGATSSLAVGDSASVSKASSTALGRLASADNENSVALGYRSTTHYWGNPNTREASASAIESGTNVHGLSIKPYLPQGSTLGDKLDKLDGATAGYVSVGGWIDKAGAQVRGLRRIVNVAPGALDTDAVTVAQLRDWTDKSAHFLSIAGASNKSATDYPDINDPLGTKSNNKVVKIKSNFDNDTATGTNALALGVYAYANGQKSVAMGPNAYANVDHGVAIGDNAQAWSEGDNGNSGVAIGKDAKAYYWNALALGTNSNVSGWNSLALGPNARVGVVKTVDPTTGNVTNAGTKVNDGVAIGRAAEVDGASSIALGAATKITTATNAVAIGPGAKVLEGKDADNKAAPSTGAVALGSNASVTGSKYSVALGLNSAVEYNDTKAPTKAAFTNENINDPGNGVVSVGNNSTVKRRIINVASGVNDNDAVTVKQLRASTQKYYSVNTSDNNDKSVNGIANVKSNINNDGATGIASVAIGSYAQASGHYATAIGRDVTTTGYSAVGMGTDVSSVGEKAVTIGFASNGMGNSSIALGDSAYTGYTTTENIANPPAGGATTKTVNNGATEGVAIGKSAVVESNYGVAIGGNAKVERDGTKDAESSIAIGASAKVTGAKYSVALGLNSKVVYDDTKVDTTAAFSGESNKDTTSGVVSVGGNGKYRRILNVAGGVNDNDAVNVKQLRAAAWGLKTQSGTAAAADVTPDANGKVTLKAGNNVSIDNANGVVTINATGIQSVSSGNTNALGVTTTNGAVTITPNLAGTITGTGNDANKLVTAGVVNTAISNIPVTSFKADAGGSNNTAGVFTPTSAKKQVNITGAGADGTTNEKWSQGNARFYSENIGTHVNSDGRILVGLKNKIAVNEVATYDYNAAGTRATTQGPTLSFTGLDMKNKKITNVAGGEINATSTDAINGSQLYTKLAEKANVADLANKANVSDLANKVDKTAELHVKAGDYTVKDNGEVSLIQEDANGTQNSSKGFKIKGLATKGDITNINTTLAGKADKSYVDDQIGTVSNLGYKANNETTAKQVAVGTGLHFKSGTGTVGATATTTNAVTTKTGIAISTEADGVVNIGLDAATRSAIDNAANKNLSNLSTAGEEKVKDLAANAVKVAPGKNVTVTPKTTNHVTTYTVDAIDTKVAAGEGLEVTGGAEDTNKVRAYTVGLSQATKETLAKVNGIAKTVGANGVDGRDGKSGTGTDAGMGKDGLTKEDGLNGKDLTTKVNALRNGEAGTVVYTDENGKRVVKAKDGKWYLADKVGADGTKAADAAEVTTVQARLVNPNGSTTTVEDATGTKLSNIANGTIADKSKDAVNGGQLHTAKQELATVLGGNATVVNGVLTGPTYEITKDDGTNGKDSVNNVGAAVEKLDARINTVKGLAAQPITFTGDDGQDVTRALGTTLTVKGATNFTPSATTPATEAGVNIRVEKDPTTNANGLVVKLADTLTNMKGISGNGTNDLVIKNGDNTVITVKPGAAGAKGDVDFGGSKLTNIGTPGDNTDATNKAYVDEKLGGVAELGYKANAETTVNKVAVGTGLHFKSGTGTVGATGADATTTNAATTKTGIAISTEENGVVNIGLDEATRKVLDNAAKLGNTAVDGRDGKPGTGTDAGMGKDGLTKEDGLNGKDLTTKVNALRNGEAGTVVYTDENGKRVVKAKDGKWYLADKVGADGTKAADAAEVTTVQARLVNPDGTTTGGTTKLSNIADGEIASGSHDAVTGGQLFSKLAEKADKSVVDSLTTKVNTNTTDIAGLKTTVDKAITFKGDDNQDVERKLDTTLTVKGATNFTPSATTPATEAGVNIRVEKDPTTNANGLVVKLADTLTNMKGISGNGTNDLVIKNGDNTVITVKPGAAGAKGDVDFGGSKLTNIGTPGDNTDAANKAYVDSKVGGVANLGYKANGGTAKSVAVTTGLDFVKGDGTANTAESAKAGIEIVAGDDGKVTFGLNEATRNAIDNAASKTYVDTKFGAAANKDLDNLNDAGKAAVKDLAAEAVKVAPGKNVAVTPKTEDHVTTYTVDAIDTKVIKGEGIEVTGGDEDTDKVRTYTVGLSADTKAKLAKVDNLVNTVGTIGADGRDGKAGTGKDPKATDAAAGDKGLTGQDGLNGKDLTSKVNALRNGEAGTVVYTDENGNRLAKANDGNYYPATAVDKDGNVLNNTPAATTVQARLVNPDGTTTGGTTKLSNIADGEIKAGSTDAINGGQLYTKLAEKADKSVVDSLTTKVNTNTTDIAGLKTTVDKAITFKGDDNQDVERKLDTTLTVKGATNFTPSTTTPATEAGVNIRVEKDPTTNANGLVVKLADTLTNIKGISGNGTNDLVIKNGDNAVITVKPGAAGAKGDVDFGGSKLTNIGEPGAGTDAANKDYVDEAIKAVNQAAAGNANLGYKANAEAGKTVAVTTGLHFKSGTGTVGATGADAATTNAVTTKTGIAISTEDGGIVNIGLDETTRKVLDNAAKLGDTATDGRDGKPGTGADAGMGKDGLTAADGLNGKDLTSKVNALRNGEAGTVVYTDENGKRVVKANDGKWYPAEKVDDKGNKLDGATEVATPQARLVNKDGSTTGGTTVFNNVASAISATATDSSNPTFLDNLNTAAGDVKTKHAAVNVSDLNSTATEIIAKGLTFQGNDQQGIKKQLGETLDIVGEGTVPTGATTAANNIRTKKNDDGKLEIGLAKDLVGITSVTNAATTDGAVTKLALDGDKLTITNTQPLPEGAAAGTAPTVTTVTIGKDGINAGNKVISNVATPNAGTDAANKDYVDTQVGNAANKDLDNLNDAGKATVKDLASQAVKVGAGKNVNVKGVTTDHVTTYIVDAIDTTVAAGEGLSVSGGDTVDTATNKRNYTVALSKDTKDTLSKVNTLANTVGTIGADGRDGKAGTGKDPKAADATAGDKGLTGKDGLNGQDLTSKVNALRNGEAGTVVYTDDKGNRVVKANDGKWYDAKAVTDKGELKSADQLPQGVTATPVDAPQARLVNPDGSTTTADTATGTKLSNIANGTIADKSKDAVNGGQLYTAKSELATALGGNAGVDANGVLTQPTYSITKDDAAGGTDTVNNVGTAVEKLDTRINTVKAMAAKPLTFTGDDKKDVERALGTTLTVKGAENFTPAGTNPATAAGVNIRVEKDATTNANGLVVKLADTLTNMKGISGNGTDNLVIKNGTNTITVTPGKAEVKDDQGTVTIPADPGKVNFGDATVTVKDLEAPITYRANSVADTAAKSVSLKKGLDFVVGDGTAATATAAKAGLHIETGDNGKVIIGLSDDAKAKLDKVIDIAKAVGANGVDGRDGKPGTGDNAGMGKDGLTVADGLNGKDLTSKVNALRNGEAGSVVYTDDQGNRVVKAADGKWYPADKVKADGTKADDAVEVKTPQARLVNPDGSTTIEAGKTGTVFNNVASAIPATAADGSKPTFLDNLNTAAGDAKTKNAAVNVSDLNSTATEIIAKGLTFQGNDQQGIKKQLGETLDIVGEGTVSDTATTAANNIRTKKADNKLEIGLAKDLVGITSVTNATTTDGIGTKVKFGNDGVTITNTQPLPEGAAPDTKPVVTTVTIGKDGINAGGKVISNVAAPTANTDAANKFYVDEAVKAVNQTAAGNANLGYKANTEVAKSVNVNTGLHFKSGTGTIDATGADATTTNAATTKTGIAISTEENGIVNIGLDEATRKVIDNAAKIGNTATDGRDGKAGTGKDPKATDAVAGDKGLTGQDGLNGKDLTSKVNALRNGEAGTVVYTDDKGNRVVKANDGNYYKVDDVKADGTVKTADENGGKAPEVVTAPQARLVNPDGSTTTADTATGTKLSNIANGTIADKSKDAVNGGQLHTAKQELAKALGGNATVTNGVLTGPTYEITKDDGTNGKDSVNNVGAAVDKLDTRINTVKGLATQPLTFTGDDGQNVERALGTTLTVKGAENFTPSTTTPKATEAGVNIRVEKDPTTNVNGLVVKLADTLTNMKGISGNGTNDLVIKNGDNAVITVKPGTDGAKGDVDFGGSKLTNIGTPGTGTDAANKDYVDTQVGNVANKNLSNLNDAGKEAVKDLAAEAVKVAAGKNVNVKGVTTDHVTTYTVDAIDTTVAAGDGLDITGGDEDTNKVRAYTVGLSKATKDTLAKVTDIAKAVGTNGVDGRDGKPGTGDNAGMGKDGLTAADGLNGKDLTSKVNALRNGEAGSVVYTDEQGNRVVKAADGKWYPANKVNADGTKAADAVEVTKPQARLVNPDGSTTIEAGKTGTVFNNVASAIPDTAKDAANQPIANPTFLDRLNTAAGDAKTQNAAVNVSDLNSTAKDIIAKGLTFQGNDQQGIKKQLGETLDIVGEGTISATTTTAANNIRTKKNDDGKLEIGLAKDLVGITSVTNAATSNGVGTKLALDGDTLTITNTQPLPENAAPDAKPTVTTVTIGKDGINAGDKVISNVAAPNADTDAANKGYVDKKVEEATSVAAGNAKLGYKANAETETKKVGVADGLHFKSGTGTIAPTDLAPNTESTTKDTDGVTTKKGIAISTEENGIVNIGLDEATRSAIDNAANKNLSNLNTAGEEKVKDLAAGAVKVAPGKNVAVTPKTADHVTTYTVDAIDTKVVKGEGIEVTGGDEDTDKVRTYTVGLSADTKAKLAKVNTLANTVGTIGADGRDGKAGTGKDPKATDATAGDKGLTGKDGLNGKDLTSKVNALRNGEAGTVVYTDENGNRLAKANDGNYYPAAAVDKDGNVLNNTPAATTVEARLVNPDGTTIGGTTKLSNIAEGEIKAGSTDAINGGQLHTKLAEKADKSDITTINNTLAGKANASDLNTLAEKPLTFSGDTGTDATRKLGTTLAVKGAANFTPAATATPGVNIQVASDPTNGLTVSLADTLTNMKGISGNSTDPLTIKNGDNAVITVKPGAAGTKGDVDFGGSKLTNVGAPGVGTDAANKDYVDTKVGEAAATGNAKLGYKANAETDVKQVAVGTGLHFKSGTGTVGATGADAATPKTGIAISTEENGVVNIGLDEATRSTIDNAANKNLSNLNTAGEEKVKDLAAGAVKVAPGKNVVVTPKTTNHVTTYTVDAIDTKVIKGDGIEVTGGDEDTDKVRTYTVGLSKATKDTLAKVADIAKVVGGDGANGIDGRDGKPGTGDNAGMGKDGLTGADGLNGKDLTTKVNALRNGEAGTVVYTDDKGGRVVKANDGKWYPADKVKADGTKADDAVEVKTPQARLVNPDGSTIGGTTIINNVASAIPNTAKDGANQPIANPTFLDRLNAAAGDVNTKHAAVNVSDLNNTANDIIAKGLTFQGDDVKDVTRALGTTLTVKGAMNFTPAADATAGVNIRVEKDTTTNANGLVVKLADTLTDMKGISGTGKEDLVIKNGTNTITVTPGKAADGATKADPGKVNFGDATVTMKDLDAPITYRTNGDANEKAKTVSLKQGLDFVTGDGTTKTAESAKPGLNIVTGENGKVIIGLSADTETKLNKVDGIATKVDAVEKALKDKADKSTVEDLASKLADKADKATVKDLADKVDGKADKSELAGKADKGEVKALADKAMTFTGNKANETVDRKLGETLHLVGTNNITVEKDANKDGTLNVKLASTLTGMESITTKAVDGLSNTTWDPTKVASAEEAKAKPDSAEAKERSKAATQGQLKDVADRVNKGRVFTADTKVGKDPLKAEVGLGDTLAIQGGATGELTDKNIGVELAPAKDGKPATMTVKLAKDLNMADGKSKYDRYLPEFEKTDKGLLKLDAKGNPIPKKDKDGKVILQKDGNGNPIVNSSTVVNGNGTTYTVNNLLSDGKVQVDNANKPVAGLVTTTTAAGTRYEERLTTKDGHVILKQDDTTKELKPILKTVSVVDSRGIRIGSNDKPVVSLTKDGLNNGGNTISNVAPGVYESDAATVGQLNAATNTVTAKVNEAGAHAAALAAMNPLSYDPLKKSQVMAGVGAYKGNKALALGVAHYANEDTMFNVGVSVGDGSNMMNAGVTYRFGGEDSMIPERYKGGPISSVYILQDEVSALKAENAQVKADNEQVKADNARMKENYEKVMQDNEEMKAQIKMLMAHVGIK